MYQADPSPRQPVGKREQPTSPAGLSPGAQSGAAFAFTKNVLVKGLKRQNVQQSPLARKPHHEVLRQEVARRLGKATLAAESENVQQQQRQQLPLANSTNSTNIAGPGAKPSKPVLAKAVAVKDLPVPLVGPVKNTRMKKEGSATTTARKPSTGTTDDDVAGGGRWTKEEDQKLRQGVTAIGATKWKKISEEYLGGRRSDVQCLHRWQKVLRPGLVKGPWTEEEDNMIRSCIESKLTKWSEIAERIPGRIGKQCRERWFNHLDPTIDHTAWTEEEEKVLVTAQAKFGNRWCEIAKLLPGRPENAVKNRWNSAIRRKWQIKLGLAVTDNKGKPVDPQPGKMANPLPLPPLVPVKKEKKATETPSKSSQQQQQQPMAADMGVPPPPPLSCLGEMANSMPRTGATLTGVQQLEQMSLSQHQQQQQQQQQLLLQQQSKFNGAAAKAGGPKEKKPRAKTTTTRKRATKTKEGGPTQPKPRRQTKANATKKGAGKGPKGASQPPMPLDINLAGAMGAPSPSGAFHWDLPGDHGLDFGSHDLLGLDADGRLEADAILGGPNARVNQHPSSHGLLQHLQAQQQAQQQAHQQAQQQHSFAQSQIMMLRQQQQHAQQQLSMNEQQQLQLHMLQRNMAMMTPRGMSGKLHGHGGVSPIGPLGNWETLPPVELDRGMASLTLSMLDNDFDLGVNLPAPKTDDSFGVNWNQHGLSSPFSPSGAPNVASSSSSSKKLE